MIKLLPQTRSYLVHVDGPQSASPHFTNNGPAVLNILGSGLPVFIFDLNFEGFDVIRKNKSIAAVNTATQSPQKVLKWR